MQACVSFTVSYYPVNYNVAMKVAGGKKLVECNLFRKRSLIFSGHDHQLG